jgi:hypothetical protein
MAAPPPPIEPTPDTIWLQVQTAALVRVLGRKRAQRFLRCMAEDLATRVSYAETLPIMPRPGLAERREASRAAAAAFESALPMLLAALPR